jgi:hypothetical protein
MRHTKNTTAEGPQTEAAEGRRPARKGKQKAGSAPAGKKGGRRLPSDKNLVNQLLRDAAEKFKGKNTLSISDLIRLLQYRRELVKDAKVREIEVRWVEQSETENVSST